MFLIMFVFPFTAVTNPRPVREAAERVLPRACCACSHQLQNPLRGPAPNRAGVAHGQPHSVCDNVVDTDVIAFVIVLSVAIVDFVSATGDSTAVVAVAVVVVGAIVDVVAATSDVTAVAAAAVVVGAALELLEVWLHHDFQNERRFSRVAQLAQDTDEVSVDIVLIRYKVSTSNLEPAYSDWRNLINSAAPYRIYLYQVNNKCRTSAWAWANVTLVMNENCVALECCLRRRPMKC